MNCTELKCVSFCLQRSNFFKFFQKDSDKKKRKKEMGPKPLVVFAQVVAVYLQLVLGV